MQSSPPPSSADTATTSTSVAVANTVPTSGTEFPPEPRTIAIDYTPERGQYVSERTEEGLREFVNEVHFLTTEADRSAALGHLIDLQTRVSTAANEAWDAASSHERESGVARQNALSATNQAIRVFNTEQERRYCDGGSFWRIQGIEGLDIPDDAESEPDTESEGGSVSDEGYGST